MALQDLFTSSAWVRSFLVAGVTILLVIWFERLTRPPQPKVQDSIARDVEPMSVGIVGAGAVGVVVGLKLLQGDPDSKIVSDLYLLGRDSFENAVRESDGALSIEETFLGGKTTLFTTKDERIHILNAMKGPEALPILRKCTVVLVTTKTVSTEKVATDLSDLLAPESNATIISFQNGLDNVGILRRYLKEKTLHPHVSIIAGVVEVATAWEEGTTRYTVNTGKGKLRMEEQELKNGKDAERLDLLSQCWKRANLDARTSKRILSIQYIKFLINLINPINALGGTTVPQQLEDPRIRKIWAESVREATTELLRRDHMLLPGKRLDRLIFQLVGHWVFAFFMKCIPNVAWKQILSWRRFFGADYKSSMLQDLERRRPKTEIEDLSGLVVHLGQRRLEQDNGGKELDCGATTPINSKLVELVRMAESKRQGSPCMSNEELHRVLFTKAS